MVLAMYSEFAEKAAGKLDWGQLAPLSKRPDAMAQFGLPTWGPLRLAMPIGAGSDATVLATQAIAHPKPHSHRVPSRPPRSSPRQPPPRCAPS